MNLHYKTYTYIQLIPMYIYFNNLLVIYIIIYSINYMDYEHMVSTICIKLLNIKLMI